MSSSPAPYLNGGLVTIGGSSANASSGGVAPFGLLQLLTASGNLYNWSEQKCSADSAFAIGSGPYVPLTFLPWLTGQAKFQISGTTQTDTGSISVQNVSGNTVTRDVSTAFSKSEFIGALAIYRLWRADAEQSIFFFMGNVTSAAVSETQMDLSLEGFGNYSAVTAPFANIDVSCPLSFGSEACASMSPTPCQQSYGTCTSIERFMGVIIQWDSANLIAPFTSIAQPAPVVARNPARPF